MPPRFGIAVLACLLVLTGCSSAAVDGAAQSAQSAAAAAAGRLSGDAAHTVTTEVERQKKAATAEAARRAAALRAAAQKALQEQAARAAASAKQAAAKAASLAAAAASTAPSAPTSVPLTAGDLVPTTAPAVHTVTGVLSSTQVYDVTYAYPACASDLYQVGQPVQISAGAMTLAGSLTGCTWKGDYRQASPVFALEVPNVPEVPSYDVTIGTGTWTVSGPTLAAAGWKLTLG